MQSPTSVKYNDGNLPNLIIIGAAKCGTTSLHYYLGLHPEIYVAREKELHFFVNEKNWHKGIEWYKSNFRGDARIYAEASPSYAAYPTFEGVPRRMHAIVPETRLIYILRNPIERMISLYINNYADGKEDRKIEEVLSNLDDNHYISTSKYFMQIEQYLNYFPESNILITTLEDLHQQRLPTLKRIFRFLALDDSFHSPDFYRIKHQSTKKRRKNQMGLLLKRMYEATIAKMLRADLRMDIGQFFAIPFSTRIERPILSESLQTKIIDYLHDDMSCLRAYTGRNFDCWSGCLVPGPLP